MARKLEFGADAWVEAAGEILAAAVAEAGTVIAGQALCLCETFGDAPVHVRNPGSTDFAWAFQIDADGATRAVRGGLPNPTFSMRADYQGALPGVRTILEKTPESIAARAELRRAAVAAGYLQVTGSLDDVTHDMRVVVIELHNRLADITA